MTTRTVASTPLDYINNTRMTKFHYMLFASLFIAQMADGYELIISAYALPGIAAEFGVSGGTLGLVGAVQNLGMVVGALLGGVLADRIGRRAPLMIAISLFSIGAAISWGAPNLEVLIFARVVGGIGIGMQFPVVSTILAEFVPVRYRSKAMPLLQLGVGLGTVAGGLIGVYLIAPLGWRSGFLVGVIPLLLLVWIARSCPESVRYLLLAGKTDRAHAVVQRIARSQGEVVEFVEEPAVDAKPERTSIRNLPKLFRGYMSVLIGMTLTIFFLNITAFASSTWLPSLFIEAGETAIVSFSLTLYVSIISTVLSYFIAAAALDRGKERRFGFAATLGIGALAYALFGVAFMAYWPLYIAVVCQAVWTMANSVGNSYYYTLGTELFPTAIRSRALATASGIGRIGAVIGPWLLGLLLGFGLSVSSVVFLFVIPVLAAVVLALAMIRGGSRNISLERSSTDVALTNVETATDTGQGDRK